jgi:hypothetical protein
MLLWTYLIAMLLPVHRHWNNWNNLNNWKCPQHANQSMSGHCDLLTYLLFFVSLSLFVFPLLVWDWLHVFVVDISSDYQLMLNINGFTNSLKGSPHENLFSGFIQQRAILRPMIYFHPKNMYFHMKRKIAFWLWILHSTYLLEVPGPRRVKDPQRWRL